MAQQTTHSGAFRLARTGAIALLALIAVLLLTPAPGQAATATSKGQATLALSGAAGKALRSAGVKTTVRSGAAPKKTTLTLPVAVSVVSGGGIVGLKGTVAFAHGKRTAVFSGLRLSVSAKRKLSISASFAGDRVTLLTGTAPLKGFLLNQTYSLAAFSQAVVKLAPATAKALRTQLKLKRSPTGTLGTLALTAPPAPVVPIVSTPTTTAPAPVVPGSTVRPVTSASITWHPRDSFIRYLADGEGTTVAGNATADPATTGCTAPGTVDSSPLQRNFHFTFVNGTYDTATGTASLQFSGTVNAKYSAHGIDLDFSNPLIQLGPGQPQLGFQFNGRLDTPASSALSSLANLTQSPPLAAVCSTDPPPTTSANPTVNGTTYSYERMHAILNDAGSTVLHGYLPSGAEFGWLTTTFTTG
jgi:hypothetical protein